MRSRSWPEDTCALARVIAARPVRRLARSGRARDAVPDLDLYDPASRRSRAERAIDWAKEAEQAGARRRPAHHQLRGRRVQRFIRSRRSTPPAWAFTAATAAPVSSLSVVPVASDNGSMQRDYWYSAQRKLARWRRPAAVGRKAAERALRRLNARQVSTCEVPVVFDPEMAAGLMRHLAGAVSGYALYKGDLVPHRQARRSASRRNR